MSEHSRGSPCGVCEAPDSVKAMKTVCCVMLANGREAMVRRAVHAWQAQTYPARRLLIYDTSPDDINDLCDKVGITPDGGDIDVLESRALDHHGNQKTIGYLRNRANAAAEAFDIILHWDSDDWSHPNRIAEQVALLEASGKEAVGYRDMLFWRDIGFTAESTKADIAAGDGEAWLYTNRNPQYCLGTSLCYWREVWQRNPFADTSAGEDTLWLRGVQSMGVESSTGTTTLPASVMDAATSEGYDKPRMIASIHGGNTYARIEPRAEEWKRVPEWDAHCRKVMAL